MALFGSDSGTHHTLPPASRGLFDVFAYLPHDHIPVGREPNKARKTNLDQLLIQA
jgi:hypothetical protein